MFKFPVTNILFCFNIHLYFYFIFKLKNKVFLGDSGVYLLGSIVIVLLVYEYNVFQTIKFADEIFLLLILPGWIY